MKIVKESPRSVVIVHDDGTREEFKTLKKALKRKKELKDKKKWSEKKIISGV